MEPSEICLFCLREKDVLSREIVAAHLPRHLGAILEGKNLLLRGANSFSFKNTPHTHTHSFQVIHLALSK